MEGDRSGDRIERFVGERSGDMDEEADIGSGEQIGFQGDLKKAGSKSRSF